MMLKRSAGYCYRTVALVTFPLIKCVVRILPVLGLMSHCDITRICGVITLYNDLYNNIIELSKRCFHALHDINYLFNKMAGEFSISVDL